MRGKNSAFARFNYGSSRKFWGKSGLRARLRTRKVTGRDASLPAPLLSAFGILVARGTVGALPQTPQGTLSLDPFSRLGWSRFHAPSACSFLGLRLSPCLLPQLSVKNLLFPLHAFGCFDAYQPQPRLNNILRRLRQRHARGGRRRFAIQKPMLIIELIIRLRNIRHSAGNH